MVQKVSFRYNESTPWIYKNLEFGMDLDTRLALVGPNGAGKSTLLKLIAGEVTNVNCLVLQMAKNWGFEFSERYSRSINTLF